MLCGAGVGQESVGRLLRGTLGRGWERDVVAIPAWLVLVKEEFKRVGIALAATLRRH